MKERRNGYCGDIDEVWQAWVKAAIIMTVICLVAMLVAFLSNDSPEYVREYNTDAVAFNALPEEQRKLMGRFFVDGKLDENYMIKFKQASIPLGKEITFIALVGIVALAIISSSVALRKYLNERMPLYYFADLPFAKAYGWAMLGMLFPVGWPPLLVSRICMWRDRRPKKQAEKQAVNRRAMDEILSEGNLQSAKATGHAKNVYVEMRTKTYRMSWAREVERLNERIIDKKRDLKDYGAQIAICQKELGQAKAKLGLIIQTKPDREATKKEAETEWEQILGMRGVAKVTTARAKDGECPLKVLIKVRVPYKGELYDFGDYEATFFSTDFHCRQVRSGVRYDATNTIPTYPSSKYGFCFGAREWEILDFVRHGNIMEALTLIIDCFHSVNPGDESYIPDCYRKVKTVKRAEKRLKFQQFFRRVKK